MIVNDLGIVTPEEGLRLERGLFLEGKDTAIIYTRDRPSSTPGTGPPCHSEGSMSLTNASIPIMRKGTE